MSDLQFYLNNQLTSPPVEWQAIELQANFDTDQPSASLATKQFAFEGDSAKLINNWISNGTTGAGPGIFEGVPFKITDCNNNLVIDGCLDIAAQEATYECDRVVVPIRDNGTRDMVTDRMDSFSFAYLESLPANAAGKISFSDYVAVPYTISTIPDYTQIMVVSISLFTMIRETITLVKEVSSLIADLAPPTTAIAVIKIALYLAYIAALIIALVSLLQQLINAIIQPKKHKLGMPVRTLIQKGCDYLGLTFSSSIFNTPSSPYYNAAIIPRKVMDPDPNNLQVFRREKDELLTPNESYGYFEGTFGDLLRKVCKIPHAAYRVRNGVLEIEEENFWNDNTSFTLPNLLLEPYKYNTSELSSNYYITWELDDSDLNTYNEYAGTNAQMTATPIITSNADNNLLRNLTEVRLDFALAKRKEVLTPVEMLLDSVVQVFTGFINAVISVINVIGNVNIPTLPGNIVNNRVGWMLLSSDFIGVPKFVILDSNNEISPNNKTLTSAEYLMNTWHENEFPLNNQWLLYDNFEIPFCCKDYQNVINRNVGRTFDNRAAKFRTIRWQLGSDVATVDFKARPPGNTYTTNLTQTIIVDRS